MPNLTHRRSRPSPLPRRREQKGKETKYRVTGAGDLKLRQKCSPNHLERFSELYNSAYPRRTYFPLCRRPSPPAVENEPTLAARPPSRPADLQVSLPCRLE